MHINEKRAMERFDFCLPSQIHIKSLNGAIEQSCLEIVTKDICAGGAFFETNQPLPVGTMVKMDMVLDFDNWKNLKCKCTLIQVNGFVLRTDEKGMAIQFSRRHRLSSVQSGQST